MSSCFIGLVAVLGVMLNPCHIAEMQDRTARDGSAYCVVWFASGDTWTGQHTTSVPTKCDIVKQELDKKLTEYKDK